MSNDKFSGKTVLVTGSCGTVGAELLRQLLETKVAHIVCIDNNETELFFQLERYKQTKRVSCHLADIRDLDALKMRMKNVDVVIHTAALKHVGLCEDSPNQAIHTNILGTQNVISAALKNDVERVLFTSTDKAVNPTNVMGTSKLMAERLMTAASESSQNCRTVFASTRFGNVLGSRGSVVPLFRQQIEEGGPITLTDPRMTRFIMTLGEATKLVLDSVWLAHGGEVMVTKMPVARIEDIAEIMRESLAENGQTDITTIGAKPGEKMYEELMNDEEVRRAYDFGNFFVILSAFANPKAPQYAYLAGQPQPDRPYNSSYEKTMTRDQVREYFRSHRILE